MPINIPVEHLGISQKDIELLEKLDDRTRSFFYYANQSLLNDIDRNIEANQKHKLLTNEQLAFYATVQNFGMVLNELAFDSGVNKSLINHFK